MAKKIKTVESYRFRPAKPHRLLRSVRRSANTESISANSSASSTRLPEKRGGHYSRGNKRLRRPNIFVQNENPAGFGLVEKGRRRGKRFRKTPASKAGKMTRAKLKEIAERKMEDLNANDVDAAMKIIEGTARSMGIMIE